MIKGAKAMALLFAALAAGGASAQEEKFYVTKEPRGAAVTVAIGVGEMAFMLAGAQAIEPYVDEALFGAWKFGDEDSTENGLKEFGR